MDSDVLNPFAPLQGTDAPNPESLPFSRPMDGKASVKSRQLKLLTLVLACGAGVGFLYTKGNPQTADASDTVATANDIHPPAFERHESVSARHLNETLLQANSLIDKFQSLSRKTHVPLTDLKVNPFHPGLEMTSYLEPHDDALLHQRREQERQNVLSAVQLLSLKSVLHGKAGRACMINNALFQEGQEVDGFVIETISPETVVVCKGAYRFELRAGQ